VYASRGVKGDALQLEEKGFQDTMEGCVCGGGGVKYARVEFACSLKWPLRLWPCLQVYLRVRKGRQGDVRGQVKHLCVSPVSEHADISWAPHDAGSTT
jgi:hypothetical protein